MLRLGFDETLTTGILNDFLGMTDARAVDPSHPVLLGPLSPVGTSRTGAEFSHDTVSGVGLSSVLDNGVGTSVLSERGGGSEHVMLGGMTIAAFHSPQPQADALLANIFCYAAGFGRTQPWISIDDVARTEQSTGTTSFTFTLSLSKPSAKTVTVGYATADGSATTADDDYSATFGTLAIAPGETSRTVTLLVNGDVKFEQDDQFFVGLYGAANATIADARNIGTIINDDARPTIHISDATAIEGDSTGLTCPRILVQGL